MRHKGPYVLRQQNCSGRRRRLTHTVFASVSRANVDARPTYWLFTNVILTISTNVLCQLGNPYTGGDESHSGRIAKKSTCSKFQIGAKSLSPLLLWSYHPDSALPAQSPPKAAANRCHCAPEQKAKKIAHIQPAFPRHPEFALPILLIPPPPASPPRYLFSSIRTYCPVP